MNYEECKDLYRSDKKQEIVLTAAQMFLSRGIDVVKMTDIAETCKIGVASLYRYFGTKSSIVTAAGALLWQDVAKLFEGVYECPYFTEKNGLLQVRELLKSFLVLYSAHKDFLRFLFDFDEFVLKERPHEDLMAAYETSVLNIYPLFQASYQLGKKDGSIAAEVDTRVFYNSATHSLMLLAQKYLRGPILKSDDAAHATLELEMVIDMAITYLKTDNKKSEEKA